MVYNKYLFYLFVSSINKSITIFISIDATYSTGLGRLVNDSPRARANATMKKIIIDNQTYLCLFATCNIPSNTELRYDYGASDLHWRTKGTKIYIRHLVVIISLLYLYNYYKKKKSAYEPSGPPGRSLSWFL